MLELRNEETAVLFCYGWLTDFTSDQYDSAILHKGDRQSAETGSFLFSVYRQVIPDGDGI